MDFGKNPDSVNPDGVFYFALILTPLDQHKTAPPDQGKSFRLINQVVGFVECEYLVLKTTSLVASLVGIEQREHPDSFVQSFSESLTGY